MNSSLVPGADWNRPKLSLLDATSVIFGDERRFAGCFAAIPLEAWPDAFGAVNDEAEI
jgi:hypothetical protein